MPKSKCVKSNDFRIVCPYCFKVLTNEITTIEKNTLKLNNYKSWEEIEGKCLEKEFGLINHKIQSMKRTTKKRWRVDDKKNVKRLKV